MAGMTGAPTTRSTQSNQIQIDGKSAATTGRPPFPPAPSGSSNSNSNSNINRDRSVSSGNANKVAQADTLPGAAGKLNSVNTKSKFGVGVEVDYNLFVAYAILVAVAAMLLWGGMSRLPQYGFL